MDVLPMNTLAAIIDQLRDAATAHRTSADHIDQAVEHLLDPPDTPTPTTPEQIGEPEPSPETFAHHRPTPPAENDQPDAPAYRCEPCGEAFKSPQALGAHNRYNHSPADTTTATPATEKPDTTTGRYECAQCGMEYLTATARDRHQSRCRL